MEARANTRDERLRTSIVNAINAGTQAASFTATQGRFLQIGNRRARLQNADGTLTRAGEHYHEHLGEEPPLLYPYEQQLDQNQWVWGYNGKKVHVRKWVNGAWQVTKKGENYFRYNKNEYVVQVPVRRIVSVRRNGQDMYVLARGHNQRSHFPVATMKHVARGLNGMPVAPAFDAPLVLPRMTVQLRLASDQERLTYLREGILAKIGENASVEVEELGVGHVVGYESQEIWAYDPDGEWRIATQRTNFREDGRPTIEVILNRPLRGGTMIPFGTRYPWGLDEKTQENTGTCVIDMIYESALVRSNHKYKHVFKDWQECEKACIATRKKIYPDAREYPFGGNHSDDYGPGFTADVVIAMAKERKWILYITHGHDKIYQYSPNDEREKKLQNLPIICFTIHDEHAFFYERGQSGTGGAIESIAKMSLTTSLYSAPVCKIDICGEEEREKIPTFENWKELSLSHLYKRCTAQPLAKKKKAEDHFRRQPNEYYYTHCIDEVLEFLQQTCSDKVRECRQEALEISKSENKPLEQVLQELPALAYVEDDFWQYSPIRFEVKATRCSQNPERTKHLYVQYKQEVHIRITQVPEDVDDLYQMCKQAGIPYRGENVSAVAHGIFLRSWKQPRHTFTEAEKKEVCQRQQGRCAGCKEELGSDAELDHITCLAKWNTDDTTNVEFKCQLCHLEKTEQERLSGNLRSNRLASVMSRDLLEQFAMAPKRPRLVAGNVKEGDL